LQKSSSGPILLVLHQAAHVPSKRPSRVQKIRNSKRSDLSLRWWWHCTERRKWC